MDVASNRYNKKAEKLKVLLGVCFFCFCIFAKTQGSFLLWGIGIVLLLCLAITLNNFKIKIKIDKRQIFLFSAWIIFCVSYVLTSSRGEAINGIIQMTMFFMLIIYGTFLADFHRNVIIEKIFMGICFVIFVTALYGIFEYITSSNPLNSLFYIQRELIGNDNTRTMSIYLHPIYFSQVIIIGLCINYFFNRSYVKKLIYNIVLIFALYTTKTRGAWIVFGFLLVAALINWINNRKKLNKINIFLGIIFFICLLMLNFKFNIFSSVIERFEELEGGASVGQRMEAINYIINRFFQSSLIRKFIGHGMLGTAHELSRVTFFYQDFVATDNQWVSWLYNNGLIFILFLIAFTIYAVILFFKTKDNITKFMVTIYLVYLGLSFFVEIGSAFAGNLFLFIPIGYLLRQDIKKERKVSRNEYKKTSVA